MNDAPERPSLPFDVQPHLTLGALRVLVLIFVEGQQLPVLFALRPDLLSRSGCLLRPLGGGRPLEAATRPLFRLPEEDLPVGGRPVLTPIRLCGGRKR